MPHEETTSNADKTKLLLPCNDDWSADATMLLDAADMADRTVEVDNDVVEYVDGLPRRYKDSRDNDEVECDGLRRDKDIRRRNVWSERWKTTCDADDGANDSIITNPIMKKIHNNTPLEEEDMAIVQQW